MSAATAPFATLHELRHNLKANPSHNSFFPLSFSESHQLHTVTFMRNLNTQPQYTAFTIDALESQLTPYPYRKKILKSRHSNPQDSSGFTDASPTPPSILLIKTHVQAFTDVHTALLNLYMRGFWVLSTFLTLRWGIRVVHKRFLLKSVLQSK